MAEQVDALRNVIDQFDPQVLLPAYKDALGAAAETVDVEAQVSAFVAVTAPVLEANGLPVLPTLASHLTASVEKQLSGTGVSTVAFARALVRRNWLATGVMGAYKASESVEPLSQDRVIAMKKGRVDWLAANDLGDQTDAISSLFQRISDDADVYQTEAAETFGQITLPALTSLDLPALLS